MFPNYLPVKQINIKIIFSGYTFPKEQVMAVFKRTLFHIYPLIFYTVNSKNLQRKINGTTFLQAKRPFCQPTNILESLNGTQSTDLDQEQSPVIQF